MRAAIRVQTRASAGRPFPKGYARVARVVGQLLRRRDLSAADVHGAVAFYDTHRGRLRVIVRGEDGVWAEVWAGQGPHTRRAAIHIVTCERAVLVEFDQVTRQSRVLEREDSWQDGMVDYLFAVTDD